MKKDNDKNKYVAAILQRHYIDNNKYLYTFHHLETGSYDEQLHCFIDRNGNEYIDPETDTDIKDKCVYVYRKNKRVYAYFDKENAC